MLGAMSAHGLGREFLKRRFAGIAQRLPMEHNRTSWNSAASPVRELCNRSDRLQVGMTLVPQGGLAWADTDRIGLCAMSSPRLSNETVHGISHTALRYLEPTARGNRVRNASRTCATRLPSFWNTDAKNPCVPCLSTPRRNSLLSDEARHAPPAYSPARLRVAQRRQRAHTLGEPRDGSCRSRSSSR
jgi:hypothetical protein